MKATDSAIELRLEIPTGLDERDFFVDVLRSFLLRRNPKMNLSDDLDQSRLFSLLLHHNVGPLFKYILPEGELPDNIQDECTKLHMYSFSMNIKALRIVSKLFERLDIAEVDAVVMRGLTLAHSLYPDPGLRPMHDVDILISPNSRDDFVRLMQDEGHVPVERLRSQLVYRIDGITFEIHWWLLTAKRYRTVIESSLLLKNKKTLTLPDGRFYILSSEDELIGLISHAFIHHDCSRLTSLIDIALLIKRYDIDWNYIVSFCRRSHLTKMFFVCLAFVNDLLDLEMEQVFHVFGISPNQATEFFEAYRAQLFGGLNLNNYLIRKRALIYVAESPLLKVNQLIRFFSASEFRAFRKQIKIKPKTLRRS